jgi:hypothetical protein
MRGEASRDQNHMRSAAPIQKVEKSKPRVEILLASKHQAREHTFRIGTAILGLGTGGGHAVLSAGMDPMGAAHRHAGHQGVGDALPSYWGAQAEIVLRELGGFLWLQITAAIILVRFVFWLLGFAWRRGRQLTRQPVVRPLDFS